MCSRLCAFGGDFVFLHHVCGPPAAVDDYIMETDDMTDILPLGVEASRPRSPLIIAGPCSAETAGQTLATARALAAADVPVFRAGIWKPRTRPGGFEGVGERGLEWLATVKETTGMKTATEVATEAHVRAALEAGVDMLWIGARTSANPFAMQEIADAIAAVNPDVPVLVKNPVNPDLELWIGALQRLYNAGVRRLGAVHRGFSTYGDHGYRNNPLWRIPLEFRTRYPHIPLLCDPSHIGGRRELVGPIAREALDIGFDGLMIESHICPDEALSDAAQQLTPEALAALASSLVKRDTPVDGASLEAMRHSIDALDSELLDVLARRMAVSREIGAYKRARGIPVVQTHRFGNILSSRVDKAVALGMSKAFVRDIFNSIHEESVRTQLRHPEE